MPKGGSASRCGRRARDPQRGKAPRRFGAFPRQHFSSSTGSTHGSDSDGGLFCFTRRRFRKGPPHRETPRTRATHPLSARLFVCSPSSRRRGRATSRSARPSTRRHIPRLSARDKKGPSVAFFPRAPRVASPRAPPPRFAAPRASTLAAPLRASPPSFASRRRRHALGTPPRDDRHARRGGRGARAPAALRNPHPRAPAP